MGGSIDTLHVYFNGMEDVWAPDDFLNVMVYKI